MDDTAGERRGRFVLRREAFDGEAGYLASLLLHCGEMFEAAGVMPSQFSGRIMEAYAAAIYDSSVRGEGHDGFLGDHGAHAFDVMLQSIVLLREVGLNEHVAVIERLCRRQLEHRRAMRRIAFAVRRRLPRRPEESDGEYHHRVVLLVMEELARQGLAAEADPVPQADRPEADRAFIALRLDADGIRSRARAYGLDSALFSGRDGRPKAGADNPIHLTIFAALRSSADVLLVSADDVRPAIEREAILLRAA